MCCILLYNILWVILYNVPGYLLQADWIVYLQDMSLTEIDERIRELKERLRLKSLEQGWGTLGVVVVVVDPPGDGKIERRLLALW